MTNKTFTHQAATVIEHHVGNEECEGCGCAGFPLGVLKNLAKADDKSELQTPTECIEFKKTPRCLKGNAYVTQADVKLEILLLQLQGLGSQMCTTVLRKDFISYKIMSVFLKTPNQKLLLWLTKLYTN